MKIAKILCGLLALTAWFSSSFLWRYYATARPAVPDPAHGNIYPLNTHGSIAYLTASDRTYLYGLMILAGLFSMAAALIHLELRSRSKASNKKRSE